MDFFPMSEVLVPDSQGMFALSAPLSCCIHHKTVSGVIHS